MSLYSVVKATYKSLIPKKIRHAIFTNLPGKGLRRGLISTLERTASHDEIYDADYYDDVVDRYMRNSAPSIADSIMRDFAPTKVVDVGCGSGLLLQALQGRGASCQGFEYSLAGIEVCKSRGLEVTRFDIETDAPPSVRADLAISTEVAEHLPASCADRLVDFLAAISDQIAFTAAEPTGGPPGTDHVNEQPRAYWIEKFEKRGYKLDAETAGRWQREWEQAGVTPCYSNTIMVFRRTPLAA
ncbi:MAG: methyltransferase domain-containing protein [Myxococcota bacterium]